MNKNESRLRRAKSTRSHIRKLAVARLSVHRTGQHLYAQVFDASGKNVVAAASTVQKSVAEGLQGTKNLEAAKKLADWASSKDAMQLYGKNFAITAQPGVAEPLKNIPADYEARLVKMDFKAAARTSRWLR